MLKRKLTIVLVVLFSLFLSGCSGASGSTTLDEQATKLSAGIADASFSYTPATGGGFAIIGASKSDELTVGSQSYKNCINLQLYSSVDAIRNFIKSDAYFIIIDSAGSQNTDLSTSVVDDNDKVSVLIESGKQLTDAKYIVIGGLDPEKNNGSSKVILDIQ